MLIVKCNLRMDFFRVQTNEPAEDETKGDEKFSKANKFILK